MEKNSKNYIRYIDEHFSAKPSFDEEAEHWFDDLCQFLERIANNREKVNLHIVEADRGSVFKLEERGDFTIFWNTAYWKLCKRFMTTVLVCTNVGCEGCKISLQMVFDAINQLLFETYSYYKRYYRNNKVFSSLFSRLANEYSDYVELPWDNSSFEEVLEGKDLSLSKLFVMQHEVEHILTKISPEVRDYDIQRFDEAIAIQIEKTKNEEYIRGMTVAEYHAGLNKVLNPPSEDWGKIKEEMYGDFHAFTEMVELSTRFTNMPKYFLVGDMLLAVKTFNMFRTYCYVVPALISWLESRADRIEEGIQILKGFPESVKMETEYRQATMHDINVIYLDELGKVTPLPSLIIDISKQKVSNRIWGYRTFIQNLLIRFQDDIIELFFKTGGKTDDHYSNI